MLAVVFLGAACSRPTRFAATVDGSNITDAEILQEMQTIAGNADYLAAVEAGGTKVKGSTPGSFDAAFAAAVLQLHIRDTLIHQEIVRRKVTIDDTCIAASRTDLYRSLGRNDSTKGQKIFETFAKTYQDYRIRRGAEAIALQGALIGLPCQPADPGKAYFDAHPDLFEQSCVSVIVVPPAQADAVITQLASGADFATLAQQVSIDPSKAKGGAVGCFSATSGLAPDVIDAVRKTPVGGLAAPIVRQDGTNIVKVTSRSQPAFTDVAQQAAQAVAAAARTDFSQWMSDAMRRAAVTVDARYGTWDGATGTLSPPGAKTTSSPSATAPVPGQSTPSP